MNITLTSFIIGTWIAGCSILIGFIVDKNDPYYSFGPGTHLKFIGILIDTKLKYAGIVAYCFLNTMIRSAAHNIIQPWITLNIQDSTNKTPVKYAHQIVTLNIVYTWFDWFIYINLLLTQVDMLLVEIGAEFIITNYITYKYIREKKNNFVHPSSV
jgi:hypothetical protein